MNTKLSVIIPCFKEEHIIVDSVNNALAIDGDIEIIVVAQDISTYNAAKTIIDRRVKVINDGQNRGDNQKIGASLAIGNFLLFKHADTMISKNVLIEILKQYKIGFLGGSCTLKFSGKKRLYRVFEAFSRFPGSIFMYGDGAYWFERSAYKKIGGFNSLPLFDDVDLRSRWKKKYSFIRLKNVIALTSPRRFKKTGPIRQMFTNTKLLLLYYIGFSPDSLANIYRKSRARGN